MTDPYDQLCQAQAFPGGDGWVCPAYQGRSIVNLMNSLLLHYGIRHGTPLAFHDTLVSLLKGRRKILFLLCDGLGWHNFHHSMRRHPEIAQFCGTVAQWPITTVFPSTTSTASASYLSALPPSAHGVLGFLMYFPEYGRIFNMLNFHSADPEHNDLNSFGFFPENYISSPSILTRLEQTGVLVGAYNFHAYAGSGLSRLIYPRGLPHPFVALADLLWLPLDQLAVNVPQFHFLYWSTLDTIAHLYGANSAPYDIELSMLLATIHYHLVPRLDEDTALVLCADHGHLDGNDDEAINLATIPGLLDLFRVPPSGEGRATQLFIKPGMSDHAYQLLRQRGDMLVLTRQEFLARQLLGDTSLRADLPDRLGDLVVFPYGSRRTLYPYEPRPHTAMIGRHGGLSPEEMVVPLLVWA